MTPVPNRFFKSQKWVTTIIGIVGVMACMALAIRFPLYREVFGYGALAIGGQTGVYVLGESHIDASAARSAPDTITAGGDVSVNPEPADPPAVSPVSGDAGDVERAKVEGIDAKLRGAGLTE